MSAELATRWRRVPRSPLVWASAALLVVGVVLAGWVVWLIWGTTAVAERRHQSVVEELQRAWDSPERVDSPVATPPEGDAAVLTDYGTADAIVRIPAFGADYAVPVFEGTSDTALASGFGHRTGTADAGERGNYVIAGHRITHGEPLRRMPELRAGDEVIVETRTAIYTYVLATDGDALTVTDRDTWVTDADPTPYALAAAPEGLLSESLSGSRGGRPRILTLITCADFTHSADRLVAFARLIDRNAKGTQ